MSILAPLLLLVAPATKAIGRGLDRLWPSRLPIKYDRERDTQRWIAELDGYRAVADTRAGATEALLALRSRESLR